MKTMLILAVHGAPPNDFPRAELGEFFSLHQRVEHSPHIDQAALARYMELDEKMRRWPRTEANDRFFTASYRLAESLARHAGLQVQVGFNEFCAPTVDEAIDAAVAAGAEKLIVLTPMMTRGGEHSEKDIPQAIEAGHERHPGVQFVYRWPFDDDAIGAFLAAQVLRED